MARCRTAAATTVLVAALFCAAAWPASAWQQPMRLGVSIDETPVTRSNNAATPAQKCGKWRRIADRLGETYAGIRLRKSVVARTCAFADQAAAEETVWAWPWAATEIDGELPPRLHQEHQAWTIRCGQAGRRERCALIHEMAANIQPGNGAADHSRIISHFVIDEIGGKERVLWRVFAERTEAHWFEPGGRMTSLGPAANVVRARAGAIMVRKTFDDCGRRGCQMEAEVGVGARIASRLWDGGNIKIDLRPAPGIVFNQIIPAAGFRRGLIELSRLKRQEQRVLAGR